VNASPRQVFERWSKQGIRTNAVLPGLVLTELLQASADAKTREHAMRIGRSNRLGRPEDIAAMVAFLQSDDEAWITGRRSRSAEACVS
jgi:NAD(P)-dependent dehydrogenase (short-subunit alcohol dehydrogenase family)